MFAAFSVFAVVDDFPLLLLFGSHIQPTVGTSKSSLITGPPCELPGRRLRQLQQRLGVACGSLTAADDAAAAIALLLRAVLCMVPLQ